MKSFIFGATLVPQTVHVRVDFLRFATVACSQANTGWWKPVAFKHDHKTWDQSNALVYKQAWHGRLAYRILVQAEAQRAPPPPPAAA